MSMTLFQSNGSIPGPVWGPNEWIRPANVYQAVSTQLTAVEQITFLPFALGQFVTLSKIGLYLTAAGTTGAQCDLGLYFNDPNLGVPAGLIFDCGALMLDGTGGSPGGIVSVNVPGAANSNLAPGVYWVGCAMKASGITTQPTVARVAGGNGQFIPPLSSGSDIINAWTRSYQAAAAYAALPANAPTVVPYVGADIPVTMIMHS